MFGSRLRGFDFFQETEEDMVCLFVTNKHLLSIWIATISYTQLPSWHDRCHRTRLGGVNNAMGLKLVLFHWQPEPGFGLAWGGFGLLKLVLRMRGWRE